MCMYRNQFDRLISFTILFCSSLPRYKNDVSIDKECSSKSQLITIIFDTFLGRLIVF